MVCISMGPSGDHDGRDDQARKRSLALVSHALLSLLRVLRVSSHCDLGPVKNRRCVYVRAIRKVPFEFKLANMDNTVASAVVISAAGQI